MAENASLLQEKKPQK